MSHLETTFNNIQAEVSGMETPFSSCATEFAERMLLGGVINGIATVADMASLTDKAFVLEKHRRIYRAILELERRDIRVSLATLGQYLIEENQIASVDGLSYLADMSTGVPGRFDVGHFVEVLDNQMRARDFLTVVLAETHKVLNGGDYDDAKDRIVRACQVGGRVTDTQMLTPGDIVGDDFQAFFGKQTQGVLTGIAKLDQDTYGLHEGQLIIIGARPGDGKTALLTQICAVSCLTGNRTEILSLEMSKEELLKRMVCQGSGVSYHKVRSGDITQTDYDSMLETHKRFADAPLAIDDRVDWTLVSLKQHLRVMQAKGTPVRLLAIDYLQLMNPPKGSKDSSRHLELGEITRALKLMAKEFRCTIILLSQLNRNGENNARKPIKADLRDSGSIEADADVILLLWHDRSKDKVSGSQFREAEILLEKQRNGPTGSIPVWFDKDCAFFCNPVAA